MYAKMKKESINNLITGLLELKNSSNSDKISLSGIETVLDEIEAMKNKELLAQHPYKIWQGKDGEWYTYLPDEKGGRKLKHRTTQKAIEDVIVKYLKDKLDSPTVKDIFMEWSLKRLKHNEIEKSTYSRYHRVFEQCFKDIQNREIKKMSELDIEEFIKDTIQKENLSRKAYSNMRTIIYGIFKYAKKKRLVSFSIKEVIGDMEFSKKEFYRPTHEDNEQVFMISEEEKMVRYLEENLDLINLGLLLIAKTGMRIGELTTLTKDSVLGNIIHVSRTETIYQDENGVHYDVKDVPKTEAGIRDVIVPNTYLWILDEIKKLCPTGEFLFMQNGERIRSYVFRNRLYTNCRKLGIVVKSPHKLRKTYGSKLYDVARNTPNSITEAFIIEQMGHTDITCLKKHYYYNRMSTTEKVVMLNQAAIL